MSRGLLPKKAEWAVDSQGCWICTSHKPDYQGYPQCSGNPKKVVLRLWQEMNGRTWPKGKHSLHSCDNKWCINPNHIVPGTHKQNMKECVERNRSSWGRRNHLTRIPEDVVRKICGEKAEKRGDLARLAKKYGVSHATIIRFWRKESRVRDIEGIENSDFLSKGGGKHRTASHI